MPELILHAPLAGWALPLAEVPDPVFAEGLAGDGLAIDPTEGLLIAPCAGEILPPPKSRHAISLRSIGEVTVLLHVGIDTVALAGAGFELLVGAGQWVSTGTPLLRFDMNVVARRARSLVTPIIIGNLAAGSIVQRCTGQAVRAGDTIMRLQFAAAGDAGRSTAQQHIADAASPTREFIVPFEHGLHARPAALLASAVRGLDAQVQASAHGRSADVRSSVALMTLGLAHGDRLVVRAAGPDANAALAALSALLTSATARPAAPGRPAGQSPPTIGPRSYAGVIGARGLAAGVAVPLAEPEIMVAESGAGPVAERQALSAARASVRAHLEAAGNSAVAAQREILTAHIELIDDPELTRLAGLELETGCSAGQAWRSATRSLATALRSLSDPRLRERAADLQDLEQQVLRVLRGESPTIARALPERAVLITTDLLPSQFVALDTSRVAAICLAQGGATSHVAILAAARDIPVLVALGPEVLDIAAGTPLIVDAEQGLLEAEPGPERGAAIGAELAQRARERQHDLAQAALPAISADGIAISVYCNLGSAAEVPVALEHGAEGCGLLRTEFLFLDRAAPPDEQEQAQQYRQIAASLHGRPLTVRTLDAGGDKPLAYLELPHEDNPALGLRGIRTSLWRPALLHTQLRAILQSVPPAQCRILVPMVTDLDDLRAVRRAVATAVRELQLASTPPIGVMIETPASALLAKQLCTEADFLSVGTNDLGQYTLAMDRGHPELAARLDALHPAVLQLIALASTAAHEHGRELAVCGGLASDPAAVPLLLGLGVRELSVVPAQIPRLKREIRAWRLDDCRALAQQALQLDDARAVRAMLEAAR